MVTNPLEVTITDVAEWLEGRRNIGDSTVLFLGSRAGGLFRSKLLYNIVQQYSPRTFHTMSRIEQFGECCRVLHRENFSKSDIDEILMKSLQGLEISEIDGYISELIKAGFFDTIISTNIDGLLMRSFEKVGMIEKMDFQVFVPHKGFIDDISQVRHKSYYLLIKVFGDLEVGEYDLIRNDFYLDTHVKLKTFLTSELKKNVLMLGYDPVWDRAIETVLLQDDHELWFINEGQIGSSIWEVLRGRRGQYLVGSGGNYESFVRELHWYLMGDKSFRNAFGQRQQTFSPVSTNPPPSSEQFRITIQPSHDGKHENLTVLSPQEKGQRRMTFVVYSQKDKKYFDQFNTHLSGYGHKNRLDIWDESKISAGTKWREGIKKALDMTKVAVLLISAGFLASDFIDENYLPPLLQAAEDGGAVILPVIISHCVLEYTPLYQFQPFNPSEPIAKKKPNDRDKIWADLVRRVISLAEDV